MAKIENGKPTESKISVMLIFYSRFSILCAACSADSLVSFGENRKWKTDRIENLSDAYFLFSIFDSLRRAQRGAGAEGRT
ncbi:hypothetical protein JW933_03100 [candidate division FCPU426 bacterium]|nr:hypothetical protein [candidate division FCPU426 bacterium]